MVKNKLLTGLAALVLLTLSVGPQLHAQSLQANEQEQARVKKAMQEKYSNIYSINDSPSHPKQGIDPLTILIPLYIFSKVRKYDKK